MFNFSSLKTNIRFYVWLLTIGLSLLIYFWVTINFSYPSLEIIRLTQISGLMAVIYLYFTLLAGPLCYVWKSFAWRGEYLKARRALGVSAFYFSLVHSGLAFFGQLGGFTGLFYL